MVNNKWILANNNNTVESRLPELIRTAPSSDTQKFGYWKLKKNFF